MTKFDFNNGLKELEKIVQAMEGKDLSLEKSLNYFSRGVELTKKCQKALNEAEQKISILSEKDDFQNEKKFKA